MAAAFLLYENIFRDGAATASSEDLADGFPAVFACDDRPFVTHWSPAGLTPSEWLQADAGAGNAYAPDALCMIDHNLSSACASGASATVLWSDDGSSWTAAASTVPSSDGTLFLALPGQSAHRFWRVRFDALGPGGFGSFLRVGQITLGRRFVFPEGLQPGFDPRAETVKTTASTSQGGVFLGSDLLYVDRKFALNWPAAPGIAEAFFSGGGMNFNDFWDNHAGRGPKGRGPLPFWFAWDSDQEPPSWCRVSGGQVAAPWGATYMRRGLQLKLDVLTEA